MIFWVDVMGVMSGLSADLLPAFNVAFLGSPEIFTVLTVPFWTRTLTVAFFPLLRVTVRIARPVFLCALIFPDFVTFTIFLSLERQDLSLSP